MDANDFLKNIAQQVAPQSTSAGHSPVPSPDAAGLATTPSTGVRLQFSVPCFEVDYQEQRAPSLKFIFFDLPFKELPQALNFHVVNGWIGGSGRRHQSIEILKPDGSLHLDTKPQPLEFVDEHTPFLAVNYFPKIPFETEGYYQIVIKLEGQEVLRYPLTVRTIAGG